jgi:hypothetical protein
MCSTLLVGHKLAWVAMRKAEIVRVGCKAPAQRECIFTIQTSLLNLAGFGRCIVKSTNYVMPDPKWVLLFPPACALRENSWHAHRAEPTVEAHNLRSEALFVN